MPSPLCHGLIGLTIHSVTARTDSDLRSPFRAGGLVLASVAPDFDLLGGLLDGRIRHQGASHSLGFALAVSIMVLFWAFYTKRKRPWFTAGITGLAWILHVTADYLAKDTCPPFGPQALWPWSLAHFAFPKPLFLSIGRRFDWSTVHQNALAVAWEAAVIGPLFVWVWRLKRRRLQEQRS
ncbi:MAG: metal-dependent hydrolase [Vicinamibacteria bacterium]|nr:metal-dependent hydrolase [Vicinamibacteria bacterium]